MPNRFEIELGDQGLNQGDFQRQGRLQAFGARYRFQGRTWGLVVWATDWTDAHEYARSHGMVIDGKIEATY